MNHQSPAEEMFDVVDEQDRVLEQRPRSEVHALDLLHRAVSIFLFDPDGKLLLQMRSASKDQYPCRWTSSASGHVSAGDGYDESAERELVEELGISVPLERIGKFPASPEMAYEHTVLYRGIVDEPLTPDPGEIDEVAFRTLDEWATMVVENPDQFTPPFRELFRWYCEQKLNS
ncbi:NUDIX hydrolase [Calycomorphotria hydatis]|uniref:Isopentenyl-diphosphate Delta-isomerase n=1 Tax=Calycomorphotria hydatis TaxID=2528027 RepID=A0A517T5K1_9PLAN|nr:NUDIX domain-containing protein [Calycomorphotria hydatis]QDT63650.1 Isopentenyl-diphosphate Delta-isomerase [Calycomorphotria hydatis]